jgi:hypothetical protein
MKEILAKFAHLLKRFFCLFKLNISCKVGFGEKEEEKLNVGGKEDAFKTK